MNLGTTPAPVTGTGGGIKESREGRREGERGRKQMGEDGAVGATWVGRGSGNSGAVSWLFGKHASAYMTSGNEDRERGERRITAGMARDSGIRYTSATATVIGAYTAH